jgi:hypothetical protein
VPLNDGGIPASSTGSCVGETILVSGGGTTTDAGLVADPDGATEVDGAPVYVEGTSVTAGTMPGTIPAKYLCGTIGNSGAGAQYTVTGLTDGIYYNFAVAAVDSAGNVGPLAATCTEPVELADFWSNYTNGGGQAGGGYCSAAEAVGVPAGSGGLGLVMVASIVALIRKRRRR